MSALYSVGPCFSVSAKEYMTVSYPIKCPCLCSKYVCKCVIHHAHPMLVHGEWSSKSAFILTKFHSHTTPSHISSADWLQHVKPPISAQEMCYSVTVKFWKYKRVLKITFPTGCDVIPCTTVPDVAQRDSAFVSGSVSRSVSDLTVSTKCVACRSTKLACLIYTNAWSPFQHFWKKVASVRTACKNYNRSISPEKFKKNFF